MWSTYWYRKNDLYVPCSVSPFFVFALPTLSPAHCSKRRAVTACDFTQRGSEAPWKLLTVKKKKKKERIESLPQQGLKKKNYRPIAASRSPGEHDLLFLLVLKDVAHFFYFFFQSRGFSSSSNNLWVSFVHFNSWCWCSPSLRLFLL